MLVRLDLPLTNGGTEAGVRYPHKGNCVRGDTFKAESETSDLWQPKRNENQSLLQLYISQTGTQFPWKVELGAGV